MTTIALEHVTKQHPNGPTVLREIDLEVPSGRFVTLVGPSGCGKSTLLNVISGLDPVTSGRVLFDGADVTALPPSARDVALVFQSYALYPHKTVAQNLSFPLENKGVPRAEIDRRVEETARRLGIEALLQRRPRALSGGQRQRVALGRALVRSPRAFLFDEPLSNLDAALRGQMRAEIKRLHAETGGTFVYVTHDQAEAMTLSDQVVVLHEGRVQQAAPPREVYERPASIFVARFVGSPPINLLRLRVEDGALTGAAGRIPVARPLPPGEVILGVRPEDLALLLTEEPGTLRGRIDLVEPLGPETFVTVRLEGGEQVICRAPSDFGASSGTSAWVRPDPARLHFFDPKSERRIEG